MSERIEEALAGARAIAADLREASEEPRAKKLLPALTASFAEAADELDGYIASLTAEKEEAEAAGFHRGYAAGRLERWAHMEAALTAKDAALQTVEMLLAGWVDAQGFDPCGGPTDDADQAAVNAYLVAGGEVPPDHAAVLASIAALTPTPATAGKVGDFHDDEPAVTHYDLEAQAGAEVCPTDSWRDTAERAERACPHPSGVCSDCGPGCK